MSNSAFLEWGWRIPFLLSVVLFPVVYFIQTRVEDSDEFKELEQEVAEGRQEIVQAPLVEAVKKHWRTILLGCGLLAATNSIFYISIAGVLSYATAELGMDRDQLLIGSMLSCLVSLPVTIWAGSLSDRIGRRPLIIIGGLGILLWAFPYFMLVNTASLPMFMIAVSVACLLYTSPSPRDLSTSRMPSSA